MRDFSPADLATYDKIADFLATRKITPTKVDIEQDDPAGASTQPK